MAAQQLGLPAGDYANSSRRVQCDETTGPTEQQGSGVEYLSVFMCVCVCVLVR